MEEKYTIPSKHLNVFLEGNTHIVCIQWWK